MLFIFKKSEIYCRPNEHFRVGQMIFRPLFSLFGFLVAWRTN